MHFVEQMPISEEMLYRRRAIPIISHPLENAGYIIDINWFQICLLDCIQCEIRDLLIYFPRKHIKSNPINGGLEIQSLH